MEPFSIACTTCQARLRVRDESVIGQILTCPKCGSMVLVEPAPPANQPVADASLAAPEHLSASHPASDDRQLRGDFEDAASLFNNATEPAMSNSPDLTETVEDLSVQAEASRTMRDSVADSAETGGWREQPHEETEPDDANAAVLSPPPLPASGAPLLPNADWASATTVQWRNRILLGIAAISGVVLAIMLLIAFSGEPPATTVERPREVGNQPGATSDSEPGEAIPPRDVPEAAPAVPVPDPPQSVEASPANRSELLPSESETNDVVVRPSEPVAETAEPKTPSPETRPVGEPETAETSADDVPPGLMPNEPAPAGAAGGEEASPLASTLREFGALLEKTEERVRPAPVASPELLPTTESDEGDSGTEPIARRTGPRVVEIDDRLLDPIADIQFDGVPLDNFLRFVSDYSTIPITLDADILRWMRVSPNSAVKLTASDTNVAQVLQQGLAPLGLEYRAESDQLFVTRRPKDETGLRTVTFKVDDLVGNDAEQLQQLGARIMDFAGPESWSSRGGVGTMTFRGTELIIEQYETVQFEVLEFCEKLRVARGLRPRGPYDAAMFRLDTRTERARAKLAQPISLTYLRPAPLQQVVQRIADTGKLDILIDWRALGEAGWSPDTSVRYSVADQPLSEALASLLEPLDLTYRIVDESTLQVTTPAVLDSRLEIEFYRITNPVDDGAEFLRAVREAVGPGNFRGFGGVGQVALDERSNCLLVCLSQALHQELQAWLSARPEVAEEAARPARTISTIPVESRIAPASGRASSD